MTLFSHSCTPATPPSSTPEKKMPETVCSAEKLQAKLLGCWTPFPVTSRPLTPASCSSSPALYQLHTIALCLCCNSSALPLPQLLDPRPLLALLQVHSPGMLSGVPRKRTHVTGPQQRQKPHRFMLVPQSLRTPGAPTALYPDGCQRCCSELSLHITTPRGPSPFPLLAAAHQYIAISYA